VRNGTYPLARTLNLVTRSEPLGLAKRFITYTRSAQTAGLIEARRFAPVK
jgi:phosphate transport system substrate-binding protein